MLIVPVGALHGDNIFFRHFVRSFFLFKKWEIFSTRLGKFHVSLKKEKILILTFLIFWSNRKSLTGGNKVWKMKNWNPHIRPLVSSCFENKAIRIFLFIIIIIIIFTPLIVLLPAVSSCHNWVIWQILSIKMQMCMCGDGCEDACALVISGRNVWYLGWRDFVFCARIRTLQIWNISPLYNPDVLMNVVRALKRRILSFSSELLPPVRNPPPPPPTLHLQSDDRNNQAVSCQAIFTTTGPHQLITSRNHVLTDGPVHIDPQALPRSK